MTDILTPAQVEDLSLGNEVLIRQEGETNVCIRLIPHRRNNPVRFRVLMAMTDIHL